MRKRRIKHRGAYHKRVAVFILYGMKKLCAVFAAIMTAATVYLLCSCGTDVMTNVSERRSGYYFASDGALTVTAVSGVRETPFTADGKAGELIPYTLITVVPAEFDIDAVYTYTATFATTTYGGALSVHPFAASYSAEFGAEAVGAELSVTVECGGKKTSMVLRSQVTPAMFGYDRAIDAAKNEFDPTGEYEIRVRLIKDPIDSSGICWHVAIYYADGRAQGILLDPVTAKIIAKKNG